MPLFESDPSKPIGSATSPQPDASAPSGSNAEAEGSAAHIAELVRRSAERDTAANPTSAARTEATVPEKVAPPPAPTPPAPTATLPAAAAAATTAAATATLPVAAPAQAPASVPPSAEPSAKPARAHRRRPPLRFLVAGAAIAAVLVGGGFAFASLGGSDAARTPAPKPAAAAPAAAAPAGYAVQVTDEITDCADHSHGRIKITFRDSSCVRATRVLGSGRVDGRPVLFVTARIEMESDAAATSVRRVLDGTGTGNLNDLLREGKTFPGAPDKMPRSGYASARAGAVVLVAEAGFSDGGPSSNDDPALREAAAKVAATLKARG